MPTDSPGSWTVLVQLHMLCEQYNIIQSIHAILPDKCVIVLQMVQCGLVSEVLLTSVPSRSITVSSLVGCESVEGGAPPDEESPVCVP